MERMPSETSRRRAQSAATRVHHTAAPIRQGFIRAEGNGPTPLARIIRGGRSGEVRLKLYLSLLWIARRPPFETDFRAEAWAELLNLTSAETLGRRRVSDALQWLDTHGFVRVQRRPGRTSLVFLLDDAGRGRAYMPPGAVQGERYIKLPAGFWVNQWIVRLSGSAVVMFLILMDQYYSTGKRPEFWVSPGRARELYGLSKDTWTKGVAELARSGIVGIDRYPVNDDDFGWSRLRNVYTLELGLLEPDESRKPPRSKPRGLARPKVNR